ncbi:MAG: hypothetical protein PVH68_00245 [Armatimonadota bacterium]
MRTAPAGESLCGKARGGLVFAALLLIAVLCSCAGAWAQAGGVTIISPQIDEEVRGTYTLSATKPNADQGWVSIVLTGGPTVTEPQLLAAVIAPYKYKWNTRARVGGKRVYPDGEYTLQFLAHKPAGGDPIGSVTIKAQVSNDVDPADVPEGIELRHQYEARQKARYSVQCESRLQLPAQLRLLEEVLGSMQSQLDLAYTASTMDVDDLAPEFPGVLEATIRNTPRDGILESQGQAPRLFPGLGRSHTVRARDNGLVRPVRPESGRFGFGEMYIVMPRGPVKIGHRWTGEASVMPEFSAGQRQIVPAQHVLEGFEWLHGQRCARIRSTYRYPGYMTVTIDGAGVTVRTTMQGERATYFAYEIGQVRLIEETNRHQLRVDLAQVGKRPDSDEEDEEDEEDEDEEEEEDEEEGDEDANAGGRWYVQRPGVPGAWRTTAAAPRDEGTIVLTSLTDSPDAGRLYFAQRPTVRRPGTGRPPGVAGPPGVRGPGGARPGRDEPAAAADAPIMVTVPYEVKIRIERTDTPAPAATGAARTAAGAAAAGARATTPAASPTRVVPTPIRRPR